MGLTQNDREKTRGELHLLGRSEMTLCGVEEVVSFDSDCVRLCTCEGELMIEGENIKIGVLDTEDGRVSLSGRVSGMYYAADSEREKKGFFSRLGR